jgi:hypothetical protein
MSPNDIRKTQMYHTNLSFRQACEDYILKVSRVSELTATLSVVNRGLARKKINLLCQKLMLYLR